jgi:hypothetical protein
MPRFVWERNLDMTQFKKYLVVAAGSVLVSLVLGLTNAGRVVADTMKPLLVQVVNTNSSPVPILDVGAQATEPFHTELCLIVGGSGNCQDSPSFFNVPETTASGRAVRRLVIEYASGGAVPGLTVLEPQLKTTLAGELVRHHVVPVVLPQGWTGFAQQTRIYADPGTAVSFGGSFSGAGSFFTAVSGYLEVD